ncbi:MAG: MMPL family transporter [Proteobacteria bacterium]|nr:MMPL family transporter [Pseudomonadota bacterium]
MLTARLTALMLAAARAPRRTAGIVAVLVALAAFWVVLAFDMTTDTGELISARTDWRRNEAAVEAAFPQLKDSILVVVDGTTPEAAEDGAKRLAVALAADSNHFVLVRRPDGGDFLAREGLLFADLAEVRDTTQSLIDAQPLLGALAADPSLRGVARAMDTAADGARTADPAKAARLAAPMAALAQAIDARLAGKPAWFSWQRLVSGKGRLAAPTRRLVLAQPQLRFGQLEPGADAVAAIAAQVRALNLDAAHGVRLGITGEVPLADEEFGSIRENMGVIGAAMAMALMLTLWLATRSRRIVAAIMVTIVAGLIITLALGLVAVHRLNVISVAFIPLFVGLGVDFGVQVSVRYNAERRAGAVPMQALERLAGAIGEPLLVAAGAIVLALCAFLPTDYVGIAELGVISALGMLVAFLLNVTLLPALLVWLYPWVPAHAVGWKGAAPLDRWLDRNRRMVLAAFVVAMIASIAALPKVGFDFNPLHLRDPKAPAMRALSELMLDPDRTPNTVNVLAANADAAAQLAARLEKAPGVARAISIDSFVPEQQPEKLALIQDASLLLDATINPFDLPMGADDPSTVTALTKASGTLKGLAAARGDATGQAAGALAASFARLAAASPASRQTVEAVLIPPLNTMLDSLRISLQAVQVSRASLPPEIRDDWVAKDGRALVVASPAGNSADNATLARFTASVRAVAPAASGLPVATQEAARTVAGAFVRAGVLALLLVSGLLWLVLRSAREVAFTLAPVVLSGFLTLGCCVVFAIPLNFANIIAFPLLFGVGVAFHIYFVMAWRRGVADLLQTSLARAVVFSALATGSAFGALWFSHHPGTASMGLILMISLVWTLICALIFEPALLGRPEAPRPELG